MDKAGCGGGRKRISFSTRGGRGFGDWALAVGKRGVHRSAAQAALSSVKAKNRFPRFAQHRWRAPRCHLGAKAGGRLARPAVRRNLGCAQGVRGGVRAGPRPREARGAPGAFCATRSCSGQLLHRDLSSLGPATGRDLNFNWAKLLQINGHTRNSAPGRS